MRWHQENSGDASVSLWLAGRRSSCFLDSELRQQCWFFRKSQRGNKHEDLRHSLWKPREQWTPTDLTECFLHYFRRFRSLFRIYGWSKHCLAMWEDMLLSSKSSFFFVQVHCELAARHWPRGRCCASCQFTLWREEATAGSEFSPERRLRPWEEVQILSLSRWFFLLPQLQSLTAKLPGLQHREPHRKYSQHSQSGFQLIF